MLPSSRAVHQPGRAENGTQEVPLMKRIAPVLACCLLLAVGIVFSAGAAAPPGQQVFLDQKCNNCHAVSTASIEGKSKTAVDLAGVGAKKDAAFFKGYLQQTQDLDGKKHKVGFKGTPEQLDQVVEFLGGLK
jgi:hypothetical protein